MNVSWRVMLLMWLAQTFLAWVLPLVVMQQWGDA